MFANTPRPSSQQEPSPANQHQISALSPSLPRGGDALRGIREPFAAHPDAHQHAPSDEQSCLALVLRALQQRDDLAWDVLCEHFGGTMLGWLRQHPYANQLPDLEEPAAYVSAASRTFWLATASGEAAPPHFLTLASVLASLRQCLNSVVLDEMRRIQARQREAPVERLSPPAAAAPSPQSAPGLWPIIERALPERRERRLVYLLFVLDLPPREVVRAAPHDFPTAQEVYRLTRMVLDRLRSTPELLAWVGEDER